MTFGPRDWAIALIFSVAAHTAAAAIFLELDDDSKVAGGQVAQIAMLGEAAVSELAAGQPSDSMEPSIIPVSQVDNVQPERTEVETPPEILLSENALEPDTVPQAQPEMTAASTDAWSSLDMLESQQQQKMAALVSEELQPDTSDSAIIAVAEQKPSEPIRSVTEEKPLPATVKETISPGEEKKPKASRPKKRPKPKRAKAKKKKRKAIKKKRRASGNRGNAKLNRRKGDARGQKPDKGAKTNNKSRRVAKASGNSNITSYKGKIRRKIYRRFRPRGIKGGKRDVEIGFNVARSGRVTSVRVVRSSGSARLDAAALKAVKRSSPFPPLPGSYRNSVLRVTVPMRVRG